MFKCTRVKVDGVCSSVGHYGPLWIVYANSFLGRIAKKTSQNLTIYNFRLQRSYFCPSLFQAVRGCQARWIFSIRASSPRMWRRHMPYEKDMPRPCSPTSVCLQCYVFNARPGWRGGWKVVGVAHSGVIWIQKRSWESGVKLLEFEWDVTKNPWIMHIDIYFLRLQQHYHHFLRAFFKGSAARDGVVTFPCPSAGRYRRHHRSGERRTSRCEHPWCHLCRESSLVSRQNPGMGIRLAKTLYKQNTGEVGGYLYWHCMMVDVVALRHDLTWG